MEHFYDTHAHLDYPDFADDLDAVLDRAHAAGIVRIISIGTDFESSSRAVALAERHGNVFAAVGWHPSYVTGAPADIRPELRRWAGHPRVVALGETGLDYHRLPSSKGGGPEEDARVKERQADLFRQHLEVAEESGLNCVVHQRDCIEETLAIMEEKAGRVRGVFHCFVDGPEVMRRVLRMNGLVSFTGILTFKNAETVRETLREVPAGHFMLETDAPFLAPAPNRGKRSEPAHVRQIAEAAVAVRSCSLEELSEMTCRAAEEFFPRMTG